MTCNWGDGKVVIVPKRTGTLFGQALVVTTPTIMVPAGTTGIAFADLVWSCLSVTFDAQGDAWISTWNTDGQIIVVPARTGMLFGQSVTANTPVVFDPGTAGSLHDILAAYPDQILFDVKGDLIAVSQSGDIAVVASADRTIYGQTFTADQPTKLDPLGTWDTSAPVDQPDGAALDAKGDLFLANYNDPSAPAPSRLAVIPAVSGTLFGQRVEAGVPVVLDPGGHGALTTALGTGGGGQIAFTPAGDLLTTA